MALATVVNPTTQISEVFLLTALPFGSVASVYHFNKLSRILETIMGRLLWLLVSGFVDDFAQIEDRLLASSARLSSECLLDILGFDFAREGPKYFDFEETFKLLGAQFMLADCYVGGMIIVGTTPA